MDLFRIVLCAGLGVLLWRLEFGTVRPFRDLVVWGADSPFHFLVTALLVLVIWGLVGAGFGLQGLFLDEDPLTQVLLGATVMLLFAAIVVHGAALGRAREGWWTTLRGVTTFLRAANAAAPRGRPLQTILANGFLERLSAADLHALDAAARAAAGGPRAGPDRPAPPRPHGLLALLEGEPFRLLVAPAIVLEKSFGLVLLVGVVPAIVLPLARRDPAGCLERLPWLVGVCAGDVLGIVLASWTTGWAADAAGWDGEQRSILAALAERPAASATSGEPALPVAGRGPAAGGTPAWLSFLTCFFAVHALVTLGLPDSVTSRWIEWPEFVAVAEPVADGAADRAADRAASASSAPRTAADETASARRWNPPWLPLGVLVGEAVAATALAAGLRRVGWSAATLSLGGFHTATAAVAAIVGRCGRPTPPAERPGRAPAGAAVVAVLLAAAAAATAVAFPAARPLLWTGLRGYASLGAVLVCWLAVFWLATHAAAGAGTRTRGEQRAALAALAGLVALHVAGAAGWLVAPLAATAAVASGSRTLAGLRAAPPGPRRRAAIAAVLAALAVATLLAGSRAATLPLVGSVWLGLAILSLGSTALARVATRHPAVLYPATVVLGTCAFAVPYTALPERWQSAMPAAGSIACIVALATAGYTFVAFARPRAAPVTIAAAAGLVVLLNGAAFFVAPNEFKGTFPGLAGYYGLPVSLDSRDYFRATTPSTAQLRSRRVTDDFDRLERQGESERLATVFFSAGRQRTAEDGGHVLSFRIEDQRGRLRARRGDVVRLAAEEWFTIDVDGPDAIALAEEPFYRRIFPLFDYESLHMIRDGIVRGPARRLVRAADSPAAHSAGADSAGVDSPAADSPAADGTAAVPDRSASPDDRAAVPSAVPYTVMHPTPSADDAAGPPGPLGLRFHGLAAAYTAVGADYAVIAMQWRGRVVAAEHTPHLDTYAIEFTIPPGSPGLEAEELRTLESWLERCQVDVLRPLVWSAPAADSAAVVAAAVDAAAVRPGAAPGDCLVLEDTRSGAAVPAGVLLATGAALPPGTVPHPGFAAFLPTAENVARAIRQTPPPVRAKPAAPGGFTLRPAHDRGLFAAVAAPAVDGTFRAVIYNAGRLRPGDRLILAGNGPHGPATVAASHAAFEHGAVVELLRFDGAAAASEAAGPGGLPAGGRAAALRRIDPVLPAALPAAEVAGGPPLVGQWQLVQPLDNTEVLLAWRHLVGGRWKNGKPKLVIVTVSGGGIRASVWTAVVLRKLEAALGADFPYHVRLVTGASGGMVGGAYYATSLRPPSAAVLRGEPADFGRLHGVSNEEFVGRLAADQLDAVAGRLAFADLPSAVNPFPRRGDRGRTLEETWIRCTGGGESPLARPLESFAADERRGWRPSLVFAPMMVEDGRRLLVSNLDLAFATRNVGGLLLEPSSRKIDRSTIQEGDFDLSIHEEDDVFSLSAVELFRLFPAAHEFRVATAARMSASFPWVSPAVNLPTLPPRRVVDAGYYDNYGVNLSALWLSKWAAWLEENTSGVLVVQIRDRVSQGARTELDVGREAAGGSLLDRLVWHGGRQVLLPGLQALGTPLVGLSNARNWTMAFRNDEQVDLQDLLFDDDAGRDFFRTVVFECPIEVSLTWKLTAREKAVLEGGFGPPPAPPGEEPVRVKDYLTGRDAYELHKWRIEHRGAADYERRLKALYDEQLVRLGITVADRLTFRESRDLYENVVRNLKRLELLADWWREGRADAAAADPPPH